MNPRQHALLARQLIAACGGLDEASEHCRLKRSRLSDCQDPNREAYLPIDVIADLEAYCGAPLYTRALVDARPSTIEAEGLLTEACKLTEASAAFLTIARLAAKDGRLSNLERDEICRALMGLGGKVQAAMAAAEGGRT